MKLNKVFKDKRGEIFTLTGKPLNVPEASIMTCFAGFAKGGCFHSLNSEHLVVIEGVIKYIYDEDMKHVMLHAGQSITIPPKTPHLLISLTDSIIMEWGCTEEEKKVKHKKFRKIVMDINKQYE